MLNLLVGNMQPSIGLDFGFAKPLLTLLLCGLQLIVDLKLGIGAKPDDFGIKFLLGFLTASGIDDTHPLHLGGLNRPGMSGDSSSWKGWGHVRWFIEEVPAGAA